MTRRGTTSRRSFLGLVVLAAFSIRCAGTVWIREGVTATELREDSSECERRAEASIYGLNPAETRGPAIERTERVKIFDRLLASFRSG